LKAQADLNPPGETWTHVSQENPFCERVRLHREIDKELNQRLADIAERKLKLSELARQIRAWFGSLGSQATSERTAVSNAGSEVTEQRPTRPPAPPGAQQNGSSPASPNPRISWQKYPFKEYPESVSGTFNAFAAPLLGSSVFIERYEPTDADLALVERLGLDARKLDTEMLRVKLLLKGLRADDLGRLPMEAILKVFELEQGPKDDLALPQGDNNLSRIGSLGTGFLGGEALADALGVHASRRDAFFKQLERERRSLGDEYWQEVSNRRANTPRFQYRADSPKLHQLAAAYKKPKSA
jgi:hypothetical protein